MPSMETITDTTRTTYRRVLSLALALADLAQFHADPFEDAEIAHAGEVELAAEQSGMTTAEAEAIVAAYAQSRKGGRPPKQVLEARAVLRGEVYVDPRKGKNMAAIHADAGNGAGEDALMEVPGGDAVAFAARMEAFAESVRRLAVMEGRLAGMVGIDPAATVLLDGLAERATSLYAELRTIWPEGVAVWDTNGHLTGEDAAERNNDGTHWTKSRKGNASDGRYRDDADHWPTNKRALASEPKTVELDEDAIREALDEGEFRYGDDRPDWGAPFDAQ